MALHIHTFIGDSLTQGTADGLSGTAQGGYGSWAEQVRSLLSLIPDLPLVSSGLSGVWKGIFPYGGTEWTQTGSWTQTVSTDAFDKAPFGLGWYASGASNTVIYTHPRGLPAMIQFDVHYIDYTNGGTWSYRINGGTWTSMGQSLQHNNVYKVFRVTAAIAVGDTIEFQAATTGGVAAGCLVVGIAPIYTTSTTGLVLQNISAGGLTLHAATLSTSGDRLAWLLPAPGSGGYVTDHACVMHINDIAVVGNTTTWTNDLNTLHTRLDQINAGFGVMTPYEVDTTLDSASLQASYRAATKSACAAYSPACPVLDFFDEFTVLGQGVQGSQANTLTANGLLTTFDSLHPTQKGHNLMARFAYQWVKENFFTDITGTPTKYLAKARSLPTLDISGNPIYKSKKANITTSKASSPSLLK